MAGRGWCTFGKRHATAEAPVPVDAQIAPTRQLY